MDKKNPGKQMKEETQNKKLGRPVLESKNRPNRGTSSSGRKAMPAAQKGKENESPKKEQRDRKLSVASKGSRMSTSSLRAEKMKEEKGKSKKNVGITEEEKMKQKGDEKKGENKIEQKGAAKRSLTMKRTIEASGHASAVLARSRLVEGLRSSIFKSDIYTGHFLRRTVPDRKRSDSEAKARPNKSMKKDTKARGRKAKSISQDRPSKKTKKEQKTEKMVEEGKKKSIVKNENKGEPSKDKKNMAQNKPKETLLQKRSKTINEANSK